MSEPTAEQVNAEVERAQRIFKTLGFGTVGADDLTVVATALARVRIEALEACEKVASDIAEREEEKQGYYGPAAATGDEIADAISALRGRTAAEPGAFRCPHRECHLEGAIPCDVFLKNKRQDTQWTP